MLQDCNNVCLKTSNILLRGGHASICYRFGGLSQYLFSVLAGISLFIFSKNFLFRLGTTLIHCLLKILWVCGQRD